MRIFQTPIKLTSVVIIFLWVILVGMGGHSASALTPKDQFYQAAKTAATLNKNAKNQNNRSLWTDCIKQYKKVYQLDPKGEWAAAGLYHAGQLYSELYRKTGRSSDQKDAVALFEQITKEFPKSRYTPRSHTALASLKGKKTSQKAATVSSPSLTSSTSAVSAKLKRARDASARLTNDESRRKYRDQWEACMEPFQDIYRADPKGPHAAECLYMIGVLYNGLSVESRRQDDRDAAMNYFQRAQSGFPGTHHANLAAEELSAAPSPAVSGSLSGTESGSGAGSGGRQSRSGGTATVQDLRYWSNPNYTRIVVNTDRETEFSHHLLKKDPSINKPQRLYIDLEKSRLGNTLQKSIPINDDLLSDARAGQYTTDSVRIVVDIKSFKRYKIFSMDNPFRIILDIWGADANGKKTQIASEPPPPSVPRTPPSKSPSVGTGPLPTGAIARQLALGVKRIVIDPGHGGKDYGAPGYQKGVHEKQVTLQIANRLARKVKSQLGCEVILTRSTDRYLTLEERTAIANTKNADLFISIHTNAIKDSRAYGIETYFLNLATDDEAIRVAARENATSAKNISDLESILNDLMQNAKINESSRLATMVQAEMCRHLKTRYSDIRNKGVKQAPFYVLLGAQMPAILVETAFISNPRECSRLTSESYQEAVCDGIIQGIRHYIRDTTASFADPPPNKKPKTTKG